MFRVQKSGRTLWVRYPCSERILEVMSRIHDPNRKRGYWATPPVPCEDCGALLETENRYNPGRYPSVCRACQNKRYEARIRDTPQGQRRRRRKALLAKRRRLEARIQRDTAALENVRRVLAGPL